MSTYPITLIPESLNQGRISPSPLYISSAPKGRFDDYLFDALYSFFDSRFPELHVTKRMKVQYVNSPDKPIEYTPDVIVFDRLTNTFIDIEIDEPWWEDKGRGTREPNHYIGRDNKRNENFLQMDWVVIRFAEQQVYYAINECAKVVASELDKFRAKKHKLCPKLDSIPDLFKISQWTRDEAINIWRPSKPSKKLF